jgi:hypothetical protein
LTPKNSIGREVAVCAMGFGLMFIGHVLGLLGYVMTQGNSWHMPYWWSYLVMYPAATAIVMRMSSASWLATSMCLVAFPVLYFGALGVFEGRWSASDGAFWGALVAFAMTAMLARLMAARRMRTVHAHEAT